MIDKSNGEKVISAGIKLKELTMLQQISMMLMQEYDFDRLFGHILDCAIDYTNAEGATIYMVDEDDQQLRFIKVYNSAMDISLTGDEINWPPISLFTNGGEPNLTNLAALSYHNKRSYNIPDVYEQEYFDSIGTRQYDERNNYLTRSIVAIPMRDHKNQIIGIIQLVNALDKVGEKKAFENEEIGNLEMLASFSAILMNNQKLIRDLRTSFHQFISAIAWAIDKKSKHFSGHIARVSELVSMISERINNYKSGRSKFSDIYFSAEEFEELQIAGLMHDLGKIITPMHILDKSAKLQKITDRIDLVKERIDHIRTLIEIDHKFLKKINEAKFNEFIRTILDYENFLIMTNSGRKYLDDNDLAYLDEIHQFEYKYQGKNYLIITDDEYNNLCIRRGTLNAEDLQIIREHVAVTGMMLSQIRFPSYMANAPGYAEAHHEKLNGMGYPKGLRGDEIPLQARIIALADVFEALSATRPYKDPVKLSKTFSIMQKMVDNNELDKDLFDFAMENKIFIEYAHKFLKSELIDI